MRKVALTSAAAVLLLGLIGVVSIAAAPQAAEPSTAKSRTLTFDVQFSPFTLIPVNPARDPNSPFALGDEITFHDLLFSEGKQVGDQVGSCVIVAVSPEILANCSDVMRLPGGNIAAQFANAPGPAPKDLALTGGTGTYRNVGGDGTLVEFGNSKGSLALHVLSLVHRGEGA
jgi:allene oxide cyclase-like protein